MYRIVIFLVVIALLYACTSEINSAVDKGDDVASQTYETLKEKVTGLIGDSELTVGEVKGETEKETKVEEKTTVDETEVDPATEGDEPSFWDKILRRKENAVEKYQETKEKYVQLKSDLDQKYDDLQKAIKEVEEARQAIDVLISTEDQNAAEVPAR